MTLNLSAPRIALSLDMGIKTRTPEGMSYLISYGAAFLRLVWLQVKLLHLSTPGQNLGSFSFTILFAFFWLSFCKRDAILFLGSLALGFAALSLVACRALLDLIGCSEVPKGFVVEGLLKTSARP